MVDLGKGHYSWSFNYTKEEEQSLPNDRIPRIPRSLRELDLFGTQIKEATLSLDSPNNLQELKMSFSSIQKLQCNIILFGSREISTVDVSSPILISETIDRLEMDHCESLKLLSELPPHMRNLDAHSIYNIEANAMLKIGYLAEKQRVIWEYPYFSFGLFCCFPGNKISANKFEHQSTSSLLVLKIAPNGSSGSRFLVFSICLVVDLRRCYYHEYLTFNCEFQLKTASGGDYETFRSQWRSFLNEDSDWRYMGDHVLILFSENMDYEEASFEFYIENLPSSSEEDEEDEEETEDENIKVEKCGVHVSYVDEEPSTTPTT
ncbi:disease resistance protein RML1A-like [Gossypium australe]|uniref:Disease resistance protein RML1A-like n=1 Tax=Gossypium australe TaxID=47621 RepID=A0A5B6WKP1_9ROSI|nr:disease resistance protein RML1A-like [Gossypium australe]